MESLTTTRYGPIPQQVTGPTHHQFSQCTQKGGLHIQIKTPFSVGGVFSEAEEPPPYSNATYRGGENIMGTTSDQEALTYFSIGELERVFVFTWKKI